MQVFLWGINTLGVLITIATLVGFVSPLNGVFSFLEHPRPQYAWGLTVVLFVSLIRYAPSFLGPSFFVSPSSLSFTAQTLHPVIWLIPLLINVCLIASYLPALSQPSPTPPHNLRLLHTTLDHSNPESARKTLDWIDRQEADLVFVLEFPAGTREALEQLKNYQLVTVNDTSPRPSYEQTAADGPPYALRTNHAQAVLIPKQPQRDLTITHTKVLNLPADNYRPLLSAEVVFRGQPLTIVDFHSIRPSHGKAIAYQRIEFSAVAQWCREQEAAQRSVVVIGDWNDTPWSHSYRKFLGASGLVDSLKGRGLQNSWSADWPSFLRIPIDQAWHSRSLRTVDRYLGPHLGSDHLPLRVDLEWKREI